MREYNDGYTVAYVARLKHKSQMVKTRMAKEMAAGNTPQQTLNNILRRFTAGTSKRRSGEGEEDRKEEKASDMEEMVAAQDRRPRRPTATGMSGLKAM